MVRIVYESLYKELHNIIVNKHMIPYKIQSTDTRFVEGKIYYIAYYRKYFKVISTEYDDTGRIDNIYVKWDDGCYGIYCTELDIYSDYILEQDTDCIYKEPSIINNKRVYTGAEIRYWFYINEITAFNEQYFDFWKYMDEKSDAYIKDNTKYKLIAKTNMEGIYTDAKIIRVEYKRIVTINKENNSHAQPIILTTD